MDNDIPPPPGKQWSQEPEKIMLGNEHWGYETYTRMTDPTDGTSLLVPEVKQPEKQQETLTLTDLKHLAIILPIIGVIGTFIVFILGISGALKPREALIAGIFVLVITILVPLRALRRQLIKLWKNKKRRKGTQL